MTLDDIKQAAKRLRKQFPELFPAASSYFSHTQALDVVAQLHGFRHYREAQARLGDSTAALAAAAPASSEPQQKARGVVAGTGGITLAKGLRFDLAGIRISAKEPLTVEGPSGCGKSFLTKELICEALAQGTKVRILDMYGEYRHFTLALGGQYLDEPDATGFKAAWDSDTAFVAVSATKVGEFSTLFSHLRGIPTDALFVCEDIGEDYYEQLNVPTIRIKHRHYLMANDSWKGFRYNLESRGQWLLRLEKLPAPLTATFEFSATRDEIWLQPPG